MDFDHKINCNAILIYFVCTVSANRAGNIEHLYHCSYTLLSFSSQEPPGPLNRWRLVTGPRAKAPPAKRDRRLWGRECTLIYFLKVILG